MRSWQLSRSVLERRFEPHHDQVQLGVYDRRPSLTMIFARIISACLAFTAFILGLSATGIQQTHYGGLVPKNAVYPSVPLHHTPSSSFNNSNNIPPDTPVFIVAADGTELVILKTILEPKGTIILLHGCHHSATDWFPRGTECLKCRGLPESVRIAQLAWSERYNVIAVSSTDRVRKCWHTNIQEGIGSDYDRVRTALGEANKRKAYSPNLPLFAVGASSGGFFASSLPLKFPVSGVNVIISFPICIMRGDNSAIGRIFPPHSFTHMGLRDQGTATRVNEARELLRKHGVASIAFNVEPKPVTKHYLNEAVPRWGLNLTKEIVDALKQRGFLGEKNFLREDPRGSRWRKAVEHLKKKLGDNLIADESPLSEELNRAWAAHESTSDYFLDTIQFLENAK